MIILFMVLTIVVALLFFGALAAFLVAIDARLDSIGNGPNSSLAMITWGVRAIERETAEIGAQVPTLNAQLAQAAEVLRKIDSGLVTIAGAAAAQELYR